MEITLSNIGKRFQREWIFRHIDHVFPSGSRCAVIGGNGSGKSTLLQIISGFMLPGEGHISWKQAGTGIDSESIYSYVSLATPYLNLYDDFTLEENVSFFLRFKSFRKNISPKEFLSIIQLEKQAEKQLVHFSSGMRQRVKLGLAIISDSNLLLLDEPTSHLDAAAVKWFQQLLSDHAESRTIFIASNSHQDETFLCSENFLVEKFKK